MRAQPGQSTAERWAALSPYIQVFGPEDDQPRPAVLLFHGCGGLRPHLPLYAATAAAAGVRAFVVDSYTPRGWSQAYGRAFVCTGMRFWGRERAGDVLAALHGVSARADVDAGRLALAGWSHGGWASMDLMTMPLVRSGEAGLADPDPAPLAGVKALFLAYPYGGYGALSQRLPWRRHPRVLALIAGRDHVTQPARARRLHDASRAAGCQVELWELPDATHSFDEPTGVPPMRHAPDLTAQAVTRFGAFVSDALR